MRLSTYLGEKLVSNWAGEGQEFVDATLFEHLAWTVFRVGFRSIGEDFVHVDVYRVGYSGDSEVLDLLQQLWLHGFIIIPDVLPGGKRELLEGRFWGEWGHFWNRISNSG